MTAQDLSIYLKQAMELEASVYTQEKAIENAQNTLARKKPVLQHVTLKTLQEPTKPIEEAVDPSSEKISIGGIIACIIFWVLSICTFAIGSVAGGFICALLSTVYLCLTISKKREAKEKNAKNASKNASAKKDYELKLEEYNQESIKAKEEYERDSKAAQVSFSYATHNYEIATEAVNQMFAPYEETKATLQKLYGMDVLFPKYRNIVAVSTMYEYFASGRVTSLEGADGAYNLYESELRMNLIINKMDVIIKQLEDIKANQFALYNELKQTNDILTGIASDVSKLLSATYEIADATKIAAYCSRVTAQNTEALKYITMING